MVEATIKQVNTIRDQREEGENWEELGDTPLQNKPKYHRVQSDTDSDIWD